MDAGGERNRVGGPGTGAGEGRDEPVASKTKVAHQANDGCAQSKGPRRREQRERLGLVQQPTSGEGAGRGYIACWRCGGGGDGRWSWEKGIRVPHWGQTHY